MIKHETVLKQIEADKRAELKPVHNLVVKKTNAEVTFRLIPPPPRGWLPKQKEIIRFIQQEFHERLTVPTAREIAAHQCISEQTVKNHLHALFEIAGITSSHQIAFLQIDVDQA